MDNFAPLTTSSLNIHALELYTANLAIRGNTTGPYRRSSDLLNRKDRDYIILQNASITPLDRQPVRPSSSASLSTPLLVARQHVHLVSLSAQPEPENTTSGLGQYREFTVRKTPIPCCMMTDVYVVMGQCYLLEGSSLENLMEVADFFLPLTNATFYLSNSSAASMQRELVIVNKEKVQAMYLLPAPTTTQRLDDAPHPPTSPLTNPSA
jgi:hypothetical protein